MHSTMPCLFYHSCPFSNPSTFLHKKKSKRDCFRCYSTKFYTFHPYCLFFLPLFARTIHSACSILIQFIQLGMNTTCTHKTNSRKPTFLAQHTHTPPTLFFVFIKSAYLYSIQFLGTHQDISCGCILFVKIYWS